MSDGASATGRRRGQSAPPRTTLATRPDGSLRLVALADTHGRPHPAVARLVAALRPDAILHGGDVGDRSVVDELGAVAPVFAVRGNVDPRAPELPDARTIEVVSDRGKEVGILLVHIAVYGPKLRADAARLALDTQASLVVCGHSHVPFIGRDRGLLVFNPGSAGPRRFHLPIVFGVIELGPSGLTLRHVDCETGGRWEPPG